MRVLGIKRPAHGLLAVTVLGWGAGLLPSSGCTAPDETPDDTPLLSEEYVEPPELEANADGVCELHFGPHEVTIAGVRYCLRNYNGTVPAPTLRIPAGSNRKVRINLYNDFVSQDWREVSGMEGMEAPTWHDFNLTNLHFHGGHNEDGTHHEGTDWYHPHIHGSTAIPVVSGAAGVHPVHQQLSVRD